MKKGRKKSGSAPTRRRRTSRRMSGISASSFAEIGLVAAGAVAGALVSNQLKGQGETISAAAPLIGGVLISSFVKNPMAKSLALGMSATGALKLANKFTGGKIGEVVGAMDEDTIEVEMLSGVEDGEQVIGSGEDMFIDEFGEGVSGYEGEVEV